MILQMRKERLSADIDQVGFSKNKKSRRKVFDLLLCAKGEHGPPSQVGGVEERDQ